MKTISLKVSLLLIIGFSLTACGTNAAGHRLRMAPSSSYVSNSNYNGATSSSSGCSNQNITPDRDLTMDGRDYFSACGDSTDQSKFLLAGESSSGSQYLCVFPAEKMQNGQVWIKKDTQGVPLVLCGLVDADKGTSFQFAYTNYNSAFVVPFADKAEMSACLGADTPGTCPNYSFGSFR